MAKHERAGFLQLQSKPAGAVGRVGRQRKVQALPIGPRYLQGGFAVQARAVATLQRRYQGRRPFGPNPDVALIVSPRDEIHTPAVESPILDAPFSLSRKESDLLRLGTSEGTQGNKGIASLGGAALNGPPHAADLCLWLNRFKAKRGGFRARLHPEVAITRLTLPG